MIQLDVWCCDGKMGKLVDGNLQGLVERGVVDRVGIATECALFTVFTFFECIFLFPDFVLKKSKTMNDGISVIFVITLIIIIASTLLCPVTQCSQTPCTALTIFISPTLGTHHHIVYHLFEPTRVFRPLPHPSTNPHL